MEPTPPEMEDLLFLTMAFPFTYGIMGGLCYSLARKHGSGFPLCGLILIVAVLLPVVHVYGGFDHHAFFRYGLHQVHEGNTDDPSLLYQAMGKKIATLKAMSVLFSLIILAIMVVVTEWKWRRGEITSTSSSRTSFQH